MKLTLFGDREKAGVVIAALLLLFIGTPGEVWAAEKGEWQKVPLLSGEGGSGREAGGEGCQWPQALAVGEADANLMFYEPIPGDCIVPSTEAKAGSCQ